MQILIFVIVCEQGVIMRDVFGGKVPRGSSAILAGVDGAADEAATPDMFSGPDGGCPATPAEARLIEELGAGNMDLAMVMADLEEVLAPADGQPVFGQPAYGRA